MGLALTRLRRWQSASARPRPTQLVAGALGAALAVCTHLFQLKFTAAESLSLLPAAVTVTGLIAGWPGGLASLLFLTVAAATERGSLAIVLLPTLAAAAAGELLRLGSRPVLVAALLFVATLLPHVEIANGALLIASTKTLAATILSVGLNTTLATAIMILLPRRGAWMLPQRRISLDDLLFAGLAGSYSIAAVGMLAGTEVPLSAPLAVRICVLGALVFVACFAGGRRMDAVARRLVRRVRSHADEAGPVPGKIPVEAARLFVTSVREADRLRRAIVVHGRQIDSIREHVAGLRRGFQLREQALRTKEAELAKVVAANEDAEARWHAFANVIPDVLLLVGPHESIEFANASVRSMLGFSVEELQGKPLDTLIPDGHRGSHPLDLTAARAAGSAGTPEQEAKVRHASLGERDVAIRVQEFEFRGTRSFGVRLRDVSGLRYVLTELKRARQLVDAAQRSSGHFIAMMSHEIRTPLHGLMATLDMLRDEPLSAEGRHRIGIARVSARTLLSIANDILDLTRIDAGAFPLEHKPFDLPRVLQEVVEEARARADSLGLQLDVNVIGSLPKSFIADPGRIKQILGNLVSNALKFTTTGGVRLQARYDGKNCIIDVIDTGEGVQEDKREAIFDPFIQADNTSRRTGGAGLGLPISRRLSEAMGGSLVLLKTGPGGSTFRVTLALEASDEEPLAEQSGRILKNPPGRILVVEDHPANQYVAQTLLESLECTVSIASGGAEALELLEKEEFDLVLMDCQMPGMDGYETTRRMRASLKRYIPVIAMTANAMIDDKQRCLDAGMDDFLPKPFTKSALSDMLCKWLVPGANAIADGDIADRISMLPPLEGAVFDELWQSLQWRLAPLRKIYESFLSVANETIQLLESAYASGHGQHADSKLVARRLHTLLGSAGMVGARQVERLTAWLEDANKANRISELESGASLLASTVTDFEAELEHRLSELSRRD